ncbi:MULTISPECIES: succinyldiaminopimelate transaminase [unclassified Halomonas]|jgi:N-succinyldiaminopimelate aminotransferase|uniref:succinyldiaminopimelate transaminase n=1 Tax=unclassified Halomonas TaxID=2609666 RepID=UPI000C91C33C|nr:MULTISPECIES: succinyldiaminopimelate transaminase [unclassified Halomonas]MAR74540.1 succinyldiaminopimelate transaminase [Halomonas sp.]MCO7214611.1 succinyldiaminopimelate transaminase [Halomonas sp. OfavH-34-E]|tara:strand:+ start:80 stop:1276 length:1197 start_codon:yes stop_codon:yes gene_type:complete
MNPDLDALQPYPFERLAALKADLTPPADLAHRPLTIGEPQHAPYQAALDALTRHQHDFARYPAIAGLPELRQAIADWASSRFGLDGLDAERQVLPVNGTREAIFAFVQACLDRSRPARVAVPNPFYQIYEGAALLAGGTPLYLDCRADNDFRPDFSAVDADTWRQVQLVFLCSPGNPTGAVTPIEEFQQLIALADEHDFIIASDECYSELYLDEQAPPPGLLQAAAAMGRHDYHRCLVFHSLSKRSNLPGLRSGFVAGDAELISRFRRYRTYHGCAMALPIQQASIAAWSDEAHVRDNRDAYRAKFAAVTEILAPVMDFPAPEASFYLWPAVPDGDDAAFTRRLYAEAHVSVLPGSYMGRTGSDGTNPGAGRLRLALVDELAPTREAAERIRDLLARG